jgi:hypothetical protein
MKPTIKPTPSPRFIQQQRQYQLLQDIPGGWATIAAASLEEQLEEEFVRAWGFTRHREEQALEMKMMAAKRSTAFDHCTWYYEPATSAYVVVTQPYLETQEAIDCISAALTVERWIKPEVLGAPEWAFYYPGHATLVVVKLPPGFEKVLQILDRLWFLGSPPVSTEN